MSCLKEHSELYPFALYPFAHASFLRFACSLHIASVYHMHDLVRYMYLYVLRI